MEVLSSGVYTPTITAPAPAEVVSPMPLIVSTDFISYPLGGDTHASSQWQIASDAGFLTILEDSGETTEQLTEFAPDEWLDMGQTIYVRVRHKGASLGWSEWSEAVSCYVAGSDWLSWDGANDGPDYEWGNDSRHVLDVIVLSDTDVLALTSGVGDGSDGGDV